MATPPCSSFTISRSRTRPLRSKQYPWGIPGITRADAHKLRVGNDCLRVALSIIRVCHECRVPWILENPLSSYMLCIPELIHFITKMPNVVVSDCDICQYGRKWKKPTRFVSGHVCPCDAHRLQRRCSGKHGFFSQSGDRYLQLIGYNDDGIPWTLVAQGYPTKLNNSLAHVLLAHVRVPP